MQNKKIILFDGVCAFCNYWVRFIHKHNKAKNIFFLPLQDARSEKLLPKGLTPKELKSVVYYNAGQIYTQSTAALQVGRELNFFLRMLSNILLIIPKFFRDKVYNFIAKYRYNWFGQYDTCPMPTDSLKKQFL